MGKTAPTRMIRPPVRTNRIASSVPALVPEHSITVSKPIGHRESSGDNCRLFGVTQWDAPNCRASLRRCSSGSMQKRIRGEHVLKKAQAVSPSIPAPMTRTESCSMVFAVRTAAAIVAVAQLSGAASRLSTRSGTLTIWVPGKRVQWVANPPCHDLSCETC